MKKLVFTAIALVGFVFTSNAQDVKFGATAGFHNATVSADLGGGTVSNSTGGFFIGALADITMTEQLHIQPELQYVNISSDGESTGFLYLPIMAKYYVADGFNIQAGPQLNYALEAEGEEDAFGFDIAAGIGYDFTENISALARYGYGLNKRNDISRISSLQIGVAYTF